MRLLDGPNGPMRCSHKGLELRGVLRIGPGESAKRATPWEVAWPHRCGRAIVREGDLLPYPQNTKKAGIPSRTPALVDVSKSLLDLRDVLRLESLPALAHLVAHLLAFLKAPEPAARYRRVVDEELLTPFVGDYEAVALLLAEPLHRAFLGHALTTPLSSFGPPPHREPLIQPARTSATVILFSLGAIPGRRSSPRWPCSRRCCRPQPGRSCP